MNPFGYLFVIAGVLFIRQVTVGRTMDIPGDVRDLALAFANNDMASVKEVLTRRGENVPVTAELGSAAVTGTYPNNALLNECVKLGSAASGYVLGSTGPNSYDCSGLVWRAMKNLGIYSGSRFTTSTFKSVADREGWPQVSSPAPGVVVLWAGKHMGVSMGGDRMYSARSRAKGIGESTVSGDSGYFGFEPTYYAITDAVSGGGGGF